MKNILALLFSFQGRVTRTVWWISAIGWWVFLISATWLNKFITGKEEASTLYTILILATLWPLLAIQVKRWHDRNKSAIWIMIGLIPIVGGIWALIELGFLGSVDEGNEY
jgi:uncharacterized membrane protein YhaH (DUF805 family)